MPLLARRGGEPPDEFGTQVGRLDDRVDDEFAGQMGDVDVALVLFAFRGHERGPLDRVPDRRDLVGVDGVHGRLRTYDGDLGGGQRDRGVRLEAGSGHGVQPGAVGLADHDADLRYRRLGYRGDHLGAVADDALLLHDRTDHEAGDVGQEQQRHIESVAELYEPGRLV